MTHLQQFRVIEPDSEHKQWRATQTGESCVGYGGTPHDALIDYIQRHKEQSHD